MMTSRMMWAAGVAVAITGAAVLVARAAPSPCEARGGPMRGAGTFLARLKITDDQKTKIADLVAGRKDTLREAIAQSVEARRQLEAAVRAESFDETAVRSAARAAATAQEELAVERARMVADLHPIFDAEQKAAIGDAMKSMGGRVMARLQGAGSAVSEWVDAHRTK